MGIAEALGAALALLADFLVVVLLVWLVERFFLRRRGVFNAPEGANVLRSEMNVFLQILKLNDIREGVGRTSGKPYRMQDAECMILDDQGNVDEVGVLTLSQDQVGKTETGTYLGRFAMRADKSREGQRKIGAVLTGLTPVRKTPKGFVTADGEVAAPSPAPAASKAQ